MNSIAPLKDFDDPTFNPYSAAEDSYGADIVDPWPKLRELEARGPVLEADFRQEMGMPKDMTSKGERVFMVFKSEDIRFVYTTPEIFPNAYGANFAKTFGELSLPALNPPEHTRYRRLFQRAFLPHIVASWADEVISPVINDLIDKFIDRGRVDLMEAFVIKYPFEVVFRHLGLPPTETETFQKLSVALQLPQSHMAFAREAHDKLGEYFKALLDERRRNPGRDLISVLAAVELDGERLPDEAVISFLRAILGAAGDTAYRTTGNMLVALLCERPDQFEAVKANRALIPAAIEETLRWDGPINLGPRLVARDVELSGVKIPAGSMVQIITGIANRDPSVYPDPDRYDLTRDVPRSHFGFGGGPHLCLGQHLARIEMARAMNILFDRLPKLRLDEEYPRPVIAGSTMRAPRHLHVRFD